MSRDKLTSHVSLTNLLNYKITCHYDSSKKYCNSRSIFFLTFWLFLVNKVLFYVGPTVLWYYFLHPHPPPSKSGSFNHHQVNLRYKWMHGHLKNLHFYFVILFNSYNCWISHQQRSSILNATVMKLVSNRSYFVTEHMLLVCSERVLS